MSTVMKRLASFALVLALAIGLMPVMGWSGAVAQASAQETEVAPLPPAATSEDGGGGFAAAPQADGDFDEIKSTGTMNYDFAHEVLRLVNIERAEKGLSPLTLDYELTEAAMLRSAETAFFFAHTRPDGRDCSTASAKASGENIAAGNKTPKSVVESWMNSPGHRANILNSSFKSIGIGCYAEGAYFWVQMFGRSAGSGTVRTGSVTRTNTITLNYDKCGFDQGFNRNYNFNSKKSLDVGETFQMSYDIVNAGWTNVYASVDSDCVTWRSSNPAVCTIDARGLVTAKVPGTSTITATLPSGKTLTHEWKVTQPLSNATISDIPAQPYTGSAITPQPTVTLGGKQLVKGRDYTIRYLNNVDARTNASAIIEGTGHYSGSKVVYFQISPLAITSASVNQTELTYDGENKTPAVTVKCGNKVLTQYDYSTGKGDYYAFYPNASSAGERIITVQGMGNYTGILKTSFSIKPASITSATVSLSQTKFVYDGTRKTPDITITIGGKTLTQWIDYSTDIPSDGHSVGTKTLTIRGTGNYTGTIQASYEIVPADTSKPDVPSTPSIPSTPNNPMTPSNPTSPEPDESDSGQVMYRLYNPNSGEHFYTASSVERDAVIAAGWNDEGVGWTAPTDGMWVYRLYNSFAGEHHYTTSEAERDMLVEVGWTWEEGGWYSDPGESVPLYRAYNPNAFANNHHYTTDWGEFQTLLGLGWEDEGIGWHGIGY